MLCSPRRLSRFPLYILKQSIASFHSPSTDGTQIKKLLVANRGEIACRIFATAQKLGKLLTETCASHLQYGVGITCVGVFSSADRDARHVTFPEEKAWIGPSVVSESYLNRDRILEVAKKHHTTAIHPGYGFLSEDATFAEACTKQGIIFVGPPSSAIRSMGDKSEAKQIMRKAQVPVVPGYEGNNQDLDFLLERGDEIGYPLLVKAIMGGGGKGMKQARNKDELKEAISSAQREAQSSFGDARVLLERFIQRPRHVEVQILADSHGNVYHLFERDCSIQRRHQKIIEECPAPNLSPDFRAGICTAAINAARAVGYQNAGTVEFILNTDTNDFYFMEMNTRLQVEHPVTEWVCGLDLVELQLLIASGQALPFKQEDLIPRGHSIEARIYAELPHQGFLPGAGTLKKWKIPSKAVEFRLPDQVKGVRVDSGVCERDEIGVFYDPMIAKLIAGGKDRTEAMNQLATALGEIRVGGLSTNVEFLRKVIHHPSFVEMDLSTSFISNHHDDLLQSLYLPTELLAVTSAVQCLLLQQIHQKMDPLSPWGCLGNQRFNHEHSQNIMLYSTEGKEYHIDISSIPNCSVSLKDKLANKQTKISQLNIKDGVFSAAIDEESITGECLIFERTEDYEISIWSTIGNCTLYWKKQDFTSTDLLSDHGSGIVKSPIPGRVTKVLVHKGERVKAGDVLILLEAMKMEHLIKAPMDGEVFSVMVHTNSNVAEGKSLVEIKSTFSSNTID